MIEQASIKFRLKIERDTHKLLKELGSHSARVIEIEEKGNYA